MDTGLPRWAREMLSPARFAPYLVVVRHDVPEAICLYWWNVEVSAAFYAPLHCLEIGLRNALHTRLHGHFRRPDWWHVAPLAASGREIVIDAVSKIARRTGRVPAADDVVAELSFGFWVSLVSRGGRAAYDRNLWVPVLHRAFPHFTGRRHELHHDLEAMRRLRNRIMHHEPIHHRHLSADHATICRLLGYISPAMVKELETVDRVPEVLRRRFSRGVDGR